MIKLIIVLLRGGDLSRPAVVPRDGRGKAKAEGITRVNPLSEAEKGVPMGAVALELGQMAARFLERGKRFAAHIPEIL